MPAFTEGKVVSLVRPASTHVEVVFETREPLTFLPGQFISIKVDERNIRSYSLSGQVGANRYGMIVDVKPGGPGSTFFDGLQLDQTFTFLGPLGRFVYHPDDDAKELIFLATGTGVAPFKAMLEDAFAHNDTRPLTLYFGLRYFEDIFWDEYFNTLQANHPNFKFVLCLSKPNEHWKGVVGHITDFVKKEHPNLSDASAYLCGNGTMIVEATDILKNAQMPETRIYMEKFF